MHFDNIIESNVLQKESNNKSLLIAEHRFEMVFSHEMFPWQASIKLLETPTTTPRFLWVAPASVITLHETTKLY